MTRSLEWLLTALAVLTPAVALASSDGLVGAMVRDGLVAQPDGPATNMPSARMYDAGTLGRDALKACLIAAHALDGEEKTIGEARGKVQALKAEADRAENRAEAAAMAKAQKNAIADLPLIETLNDRRREFLVAAAAFRNQIARRNDRVEAFNRDCAGKKFYAGDLWAIRNDLPFDLKPYEPAPR